MPTNMTLVEKQGQAIISDVHSVLLQVESTIFKLEENQDRPPLITPVSESCQSLFGGECTDDQRFRSLQPQPVPSAPPLSQPRGKSK